MLKISEIPKRFQDRYKKEWNWSGDVNLIALGAVRRTENPYFADVEKKVENQIVRWFGNWPRNPYETIHVERSDGALWAINLNNFLGYEKIDHVDPEFPEDFFLKPEDFQKGGRYYVEGNEK